MENIVAVKATRSVLKANQQRWTPAIMLAKEEITKGVAITPDPKSTED